MCSEITAFLSQAYSVQLRWPSELQRADFRWHSSFLKILIDEVLLTIQLFLLIGTDHVIDFMCWFMHSQRPRRDSSPSARMWAEESDKPAKLKKKKLSVCLSSGWPGCWRSDRPRLYRTRPPQWSTRSTGPGGRPRRRPSLPASGRQPRPAPLLFSDLSSASCSSASSPVCIVTPRLASPCSSWRTWLDTASGTSHAWVTQQRFVIFRRSISWEADEFLHRWSWSWNLLWQKLFQLAANTFYYLMVLSIKCQKIVKNAVKSSIVLKPKDIQFKTKTRERWTENHFKWKIKYQLSRCCSSARLFLTHEVFSPELKLLVE